MKKDSGLNVSEPSAFRAAASALCGLNTVDNHKSIGHWPLGEWGN
jgi:hypothetical protein